MLIWSGIYKSIKKKWMSKSSVNQVVIYGYWRVDLWNVWLHLYTAAAWPSGLRRRFKAPVRKGVSSNLTAVTTFFSLRIWYFLFSLLSVLDNVICDRFSQYIGNVRRRRKISYGKDTFLFSNAVVVFVDICHVSGGTSNHHKNF